MTSKAKRRDVARLTALAHDRELGLYLSELEARFREWRAGRIGPSELSDLLPVETTIQPNVVESAINVMPRMRAWMFSSVMSGLVPEKEGTSIAR